MTTGTKRPSSKKRGLGDMVVGTVGLAQQFTRIGGEMNPRIVSTILRDADMGRPARLVDLTYESRSKDGHLHAVLQLGEVAVSGLEWECVAPEGSKSKTKKAAKAFERALRKSRGFRDSINHLVSAGRLFANGWTETVWDKSEGLLVPAIFSPVPARRFFYAQADGRLLYDATGISPNDATGVDLREAYPEGKFISWQPYITGDVAQRDGLCRNLVWAALFRNWGSRDWLTLAELSWKPWRKGKYTKADAKEEDIRKLRTICESMAASGVAVHPDTVSVDVEWPKQNVGTSGKTPHQMLLEFYANEMSKAVLGATDIIEPGPNGARAATEVRERVSRLIRDATVAGVQDAIQRDLVNPFCAMNYGSADPFEFRFITEDAVDVAKFAQSVKLVVDAGVRIPSVWVRDRIGAPEPADDDEIATPTGRNPEGASEPDKGASDGGDTEEPDDGEDAADG